MPKRIANKNKFIRGILIIVVCLALIITILWLIISGIVSLFTKPKEENKPKEQETTNSINNNTVAQVSTTVDNSVINEWNLKLVNKDNSVDRSYVPELEELDDGIMFDKRAISYLRNMINAMYKVGIKNVWVQSSYRSYEKQEELFNRKVTYYKNQGKKQEEAERLAQTVVQRPEMSEHNLALAADFNTVTNEFEKTKAFEWLQKNAWEYGFV